MARILRFPSACNIVPIADPEYRGDGAPLGSYPELVVAMVADLTQAQHHGDALAIMSPLDDIAKRLLWNACPKPLKARLIRMKHLAEEAADPTFCEAWRDKLMTCQSWADVIAQTSVIPKPQRQPLWDALGRGSEVRLHVLTLRSDASQSSTHGTSDGVA